MPNSRAAQHMTRQLTRIGEPVNRFREATIRSG
jgi:hypothetical protein